MTAYIITRIHVADYERCRPPVESGVLDRFEDEHGPNVLVDADADQSTRVGRGTSPSGSTR